MSSPRFEQRSFRAGLWIGIGSERIMTAFKTQDVEFHLIMGLIATGYGLFIVFATTKPPKEEA